MTTILHARERRLLIEFWLNQRDTVTRHYLPNSRGTVLMVPILGEVILGHLRDRPATASSIARSLDIPRATALRRLRGLVKAGIVERRGNGNYCIVLKIINSPESVALHRALVRRLKSIARQLD